MPKNIECDFTHEKQGQKRMNSCMAFGAKLEPEEFFRLYCRGSEVHQSNRVNALSFVQSTFETIPSAPILASYFRKIQFLTLQNCGIKRIAREHLSDFEHLLALDLTGNLIEYIPADLNLDLPRIERLTFACNQLRYAEVEAFFRPTLVHIDLSANPAIDCVFDRTLARPTLADFAKTVRSKCAPDWKVLYAKFKELALSSDLKRREEIRQLKNERRELNRRIYDLKTPAYTSTALPPAPDLLAQILSDQTFRDLAVTTEDASFRVHKVVVAAHSPVIADILAARPDVGSLHFDDFDGASFGDVVDCMYGKKSGGESNAQTLVERLKIAGKLQMKRLTEETAEALKKVVTPGTSYEVLVLANKYGFEELRAKAFERFKEEFPYKNLPPELATQVAKLRKLVEVKKLMDAIVEGDGDAASMADVSEALSKAKDGDAEETSPGNGQNTENEQAGGSSAVEKSKAEALEQRKELNAVVVNRSDSSESESDGCEYEDNFDDPYDEVRQGWAKD